MKLCNDCGVTKPETEFRFRNKSLGVRHNYCRECHSARVRVWYHKNPESQREATKRYRKADKSRYLSQRYKVTREQASRLLAKTCCDICNKESPLETDHNHSTGVVRGRLCRSCNLGLGLSQDNPDLLQRAIRYLEVS